MSEPFQLIAAPTVAATAGERVELGGVRWSAYRAPETPAGGAVPLIEVEDAGTFQEWL